MSIQEARKNSQAIDDAVSRELDQAEKLAENDFYTEAVLRLGRSTEAALYAVASEGGISLTDSVITSLENVRESLWQAQVEIMRSHEDPTTVRTKLSSVAGSLSEAIADLSANESRRQGENEDEPRRTEKILRELIVRAENDEVKARLGRSKQLLREVVTYRNDAAHASLDGEPQEHSEEDYEDLLDEISGFYRALVSVITTIRSEKEWSTQAEAA